MTEIVDLQHDLHANDFDLSEKIHLCDSNALICLSFCQRASPFARCWGLSPLQLNTAIYCVGVLAVRMHFRVTHGTAGSIGISNLFGVLPQGEYRKYSSYDVQLVFWVFTVTMLLCFL